MPSKKKKSSSRNKARKGGNKTKEKLEIPDAQMQRLKIDDSQADEDALLEKAIKLAAAEETALAAKSEETSENWQRNMAMDAITGGSKQKITALLQISPKHLFLATSLSRETLKWESASKPVVEPPKKNIPKCGMTPLS